MTSFRTRLILSFALLALVQAALFTLLSQNLLVHGLENEARGRLALVASLAPQALPWPAAAAPDRALALRLAPALNQFARRHQLARASLVWDQAWVDSHAGNRVLDDAESLRRSDGFRPPDLKGTADYSGLLFKDASGHWVKVLYAKPVPESRAWIRLEAGEDFLGTVPKLERRLLMLAAALVLPMLGAGFVLALALSRRARQLTAALGAGRPRLDFDGTDEFAAIAAGFNQVLAQLDDERARREAADRAKLGQARSLALGVAHEMRNPLGSVALMAELLQRKVHAVQGHERHNELDGAHDLAARIRAEVARLEETVAAFLDFARTPELNAEAVDLPALAKDLAGGRELKVLVSGHPPLARADLKALKVILGNLLANAAQAAGPEGRVEVRLEQRDGADIVRVWDSGEPVPREQRERLFTPFFTTRARGLGLGLATSASLAQAMAGALWLEDDGKTFTLRLPCW